MRSVSKIYPNKVVVYMRNDLMNTIKQYSRLLGLKICVV